MSSDLCVQRRVTTSPTPHILDYSFLYHVSALGWFGALYQGVFCACIGMFIFFFLINRIGATPMMACWMLVGDFLFLFIVYTLYLYFFFAHTHSHTHTHTHTHTLSLLTLTHTSFLTFILSLSPPLPLSPSLSHTHTVSCVWFVEGWVFLGEFARSSLVALSAEVFGASLVVIALVFLLRDRKKSDEAYERLLLASLADSNESDIGYEESQFVVNSMKSTMGIEVEKGSHSDERDVGTNGDDV